MRGRGSREGGQRRGRPMAKGAKRGAGEETVTPDESRHQRTNGRLLTYTYVPSVCLELHKQQQKSPPFLLVYSWASKGGRRETFVPTQKGRKWAPFQASSHKRCSVAQTAEELSQSLLCEWQVRMEKGCREGERKVDGMPPPLPPLLSRLRVVSSYPFVRGPREGKQHRKKAKEVRRRRRQVSVLNAIESA